jgi:glycosyltransferase involved in cell wall biosynthesis
VNDQSTDDTEKIVRDCCEKVDWIKMINHYDNESSARKRGSRIVKAFYCGYEAIKDTKHDFIVKLDGDISFEPNFFERIFLEFEGRPRLGITSGVSYIEMAGKWVEEKSAKGHTLGATKVYRKQCFEDIGGLVPFIGWDGIDEIKARMVGWDAENIPDLIAYHHRPEGRETGSLKASYEDGVGAYFMGYHPLFLLLRGIWRMKNQPYVLGGLNLIYAYFKSALNKDEKINDENFIKFVRVEQLKKLSFRKSLV